MMVPSDDVSVAKKVLIPAAVATAIGIAGLGGVHHGGERVCSQTKMCQPEKIAAILEKRTNQTNSPDFHRR